MTPELSIDVRGAGGERVVAVAGEVDMASAPQLSRALADVDGTVVVDLGGVTFLDSSGIAVLVETRNRIRKAGGDLTLRNPLDHVQTMLNVLGLAEWIE